MSGGCPPDGGRAMWLGLRHIVRGHTSVGQMRPYIVRQGDHLVGIAAREGFDPEEVWNHPDNEALREQRESGQVLAPGDVLYIPEPRVEPCGIDAETKNRYRVTVPKVVVRTQLRSGPEVLANEPYRLEGLRHPRTGQSDGEGFIEEEVSARTRELRLVLPQRQDYTVRLDLGHLDPAAHRSGVRQRLEARGYLFSLDGVASTPPPPLRRDEEDAAISDALRRFQADHGLDETGELDEATLAALEEDP